MWSLKFVVGQNLFKEILSLNYKRYTLHSSKNKLFGSKILNLGYFMYDVKVSVMEISDLTLNNGLSKYYTNADWLQNIVG